MARLGRPGLTDDRKAELWRRWHDGQGYSDIGRALGKVPASIFGVPRMAAAAARCAGAVAPRLFQAAKGPGTSRPGERQSAAPVAAT